MERSIKRRDWTEKDMREIREEQLPIEKETADLAKRSSTFSRRFSSAIFFASFISILLQKREGIRHCLPSWSTL